jgi:DNA repair protein RecO (recombination protein O)
VIEWEDEAFVLAARAHGETGALVEFLTEGRGRVAAHVAGGASRRLKPFLQPGARVTLAFRARTTDQLGQANLEPVGEGPSALFDDPAALAGLAAAASLAAGALPEREPHPGAFYAFEAFVAALAATDLWPAVYVRFEAGLLEELGFGLDLTRCAATGATDDLLWVSPRTGRAVSREAGAPFAEKLFDLPPFLMGAQSGLVAGDVEKGLRITGHFLEKCVFDPLNKPLPPPRLWMIERLRGLGRL